MKNRFKLAAASAILASSLTLSAESEPEVSFSSTEVAPGIFMLMGEGGFTGGNLGLSVGDDGVVLIDDSMPNFLDMMNKAIMKHTNKPIDFVINTHVHGDHTGNNEALGKKGVHIVAHENLREHLVTKGMNGKPAPKDALPVITFSHSMSFHLNGSQAKLVHVPRAHTDGDAIVHFPDANVIHTGDTLFNGMFPYIDIDNGGSVDGFIKAQEAIVKMANDKTKIIAGHGPLASKKDVQASIDMLKDARKMISQLIKQGKNADEVVKMNPLQKYHEKWNWRFITTEKMTRQVYRGLSGKDKSAMHNHGDKSHSHGH